eukprot:scaffold85724_cov50-Attheya_sp.AAC.3
MISYDSVPPCSPGVYFFFVRASHRASRSRPLYLLTLDGTRTQSDCEFCEMSFPGLDSSRFGFSRASVHVQCPNAKTAMLD